MIFYSCLTGWLEPLLDRVATGEDLIVAPVINGIDYDTFAVDREQLTVLGGFHLHSISFDWIPLSPERQAGHPQHEAYKYGILRKPICDIVFYIRMFRVLCS